MSRVVLIPAGIDIDVIFERNNIRQDRSKSRLKDYIYYFLSRVVTHHSNYELFLEDDGFRPISTNKLKTLFCSRNRDRVIKMLKDPEDPIVEDNGSYQVGNYTKSYRLTEKYRTGEVEFKTLGKKFSEKIIQLEVVDPSRPDYGFLEKQFHDNRLEFSSDFDKYLSQMGLSLLSKSTNEFQINLIHNKIGGLLRYQEYLKSGFFQVNHSYSNHRFTSILTSIPKVTRNFLQIGGSPLVEVDLGSSQPYLLAVILKGLDQSVISDNPLESDKSITGSTFSISEYIINTSNDLLNKVYPFMLPAFSGLSPSQKESVRGYCSAPYDQDFYQWLVDQTGNKIKREDVKNMFMYFLFDDNFNHRNHIEVIKEIGVQFPGVNHFIGLMHNKFGKSDFAKFLQMIESHLLINLILRGFHEHYPHIPIFTIHDAILTTEEFAQLIQNHLEERLIELTSIQPRLNIKSPAPFKTILEESINKRWKEIKNIKKKSQYSKLKHSVFSSNIERGKKFLSD